MALFFSRRKTAPRESAEAEELNVVPYLDILMNLIIFVLLSMTGLATFGTVNVSARSGPGEGASPIDVRLFTVAISQLGFSLASGTDSPSTLPRKPDGSFDYEGLNARARLYKPDFAPSSKVIIVADQTTPFDILVSTMDALRETPEHQPLFHDVTLAAF